MQVADLFRVDTLPEAVGHGRTGRIGQQTSGIEAVRPVEFAVGRGLDSDQSACNLSDLSIQWSDTQNL